MRGFRDSLRGAPYILFLTFASNPLYIVPADGGHPSELPIPHAFKAAISPDGKHIAYTPLPERFRQWKN